MDTQLVRTARRMLLALLLGAALGGCVYAPPYAAYDPYYASYYSYPAYPTYVGPPVALSFDFGYYKHHGGYRGHRHGYHHGYRGGHGRHYGGWGYRRR